MRGTDSGKKSFSTHYFYRIFCHFIALFCLVSFQWLYAFDHQVVNVFTWGDEIGPDIIRQFEKETGIKVNYSSYENNEMLYAKLKVNSQGLYDVIEPSSYYVTRLRNEHLLQKIPHSLLPHFNNLDSFFVNQSYDQNAEYSIPFTWGITGIAVNKRYYPDLSLTHWNQLWDKKFQDQLLMLDDMREVFGMALLSLGFSVNEKDPKHIQAAYQKLFSLKKNWKLFTVDTLISVYIDEDAIVGMGWNGAIFKARGENKFLDFIYPKEGFAMWVDTLAIPSNAPHPENAAKFIDFLLRADVASKVMLRMGYASPNQAARELLPKAVRESKILYPNKNILKQAQIIEDLDPQLLALYEHYWQKLKLY